MGSELSSWVANPDMRSPAIGTAAVSRVGQAVVGLCLETARESLMPYTLLQHHNSVVSASTPLTETTGGALKGSDINDTMPVRCHFRHFQAVWACYRAIKRLSSPLAPGISAVAAAEAQLDQLPEQFMDFIANPDGSGPRHDRKSRRVPSAHGNRGVRYAELFAHIYFWNQLRELFFAMKLTPKQRRFVDEYQIDLNATQAAIRAGYSAKTAEQQGPRLLGNVGVAAAIQAAQTEIRERTEITVDEVVAGLLAEAQDKTDGTAGSRVAAWSHLGKHLGMDRKDIQLRIDQPRAEDMSPAEVAEELVLVQAQIEALEAAK